MPSAQPVGEPAPDHGRLPADSLRDRDGHPFGIYVHVPFCRVRCGYCDFNTYTPAELGPDGTTTASYSAGVIAEIDLAATVLGTERRVETVFVGGGTPTMLDPADLGRMIEHIDHRFGLAPGAEITTEANPDSVTPESLRHLADAGYTRVSLGMQSAVPHVLATLERTHDPANVARAVNGAKAADLAVSLDLIYGTPGESLADWQTSLEAAIALEPDHISAYALVVEAGTKLAAQVRRGQVAAPDDDDEAAKYELADDLLGRAGYRWYEVSNWSRTERGRCRHNEGYWRDGDWWGIGPGAHSHVGGVRWWNLKHPARYASRLADKLSPAAGRELLTNEQRHDEQVLLQVRLAEGLPMGLLHPTGRQAVVGLVSDGLVDGPLADADRVALTRRGRLLTDTVVRRLLGF